MLNKTQTLQLFFSILFYILAFLAACAMAHTRRFPFNRSVWCAIFGFLLLLDMLVLVFSWPELISSISTSEPFYHQVFAILGAQCIRSLMYSGALSILLIAVTNLNYRYTLKHNSSRTFYALGLGSLIAGLEAVIEWLKPSLKPHWANYAPLNSLAPTTTIMVHALFDFFTIGIALCMLYALVDYLTNTGNRNFFFGSVCMLLFGLCATARQPIYSMEHWLFAGISLGIMVIAAYYILLRFDRALTPLVVLPPIVGDQFHQAILNAFSESIPMHLLAAMYCIIAAYFWSYSFNLLPERTYET